MDDRRAIRVLADGLLAGPANMARDEALLIRVGRGESPPTLRLYQWDPPTISLGYFQRFADREALPAPLKGLAVVRRLTGGGAILHDLELTYSLTLPLCDGICSCGPNGLYQIVHEAIIASLREMGIRSACCGVTDGSSPTRGPLFCFARRHRFDVLIGEDKVAGSAQRRTRDAVLQHGSIVVADRFKQPSVAKLSVPFDGAIAHLRRAIPEQLARLAARPFEAGVWREDELLLAGALDAKYAGGGWTRRL